MASIVQSVTGFAVNGGGTLVFGSNLVAGNDIVVVGVHSYAGCPPSVSDSQGNTYAHPVNAVQPSGGRYFHVWTAPVGSSAANTITCAMACGNLYGVIALEVAGLDASTKYEAHSVGIGSTNPVQAGSITPTVNNSLLVSIFHDISGGSTWAAMSGWTEVAESASCQIQTYIQPTAAAINPEGTATSSPGTSFGYAVAFKSAAGGGGGGAKHGVVNSGVVTSLVNGGLVR